MKIACINHQPVSLYIDRGWSKERLANYYNPDMVADEVIVAAGKEPKPFDLSENVHIVGYRSSEELANIVNHFQPDIIRCYESNYPLSELSLDLASAAKIPSYLSLHDSRKEYTKALSGYTVITAYTESVQRRASAYIGREIELQRNGVDSTFFDPSLVDRKKAILDAENNGIDLDYDFLIYTIGGIGYVENINAQVHAVRLFKEASKLNVKLIISGPELNEIKWKELGADFVYAIGSTSQSTVRSIYSLADCFMQVKCVPEIGMATTEALMMGVPIIHLNGEEASRIIKWPLGLMVDSFDSPQAIADVVEFMYYNIDNAKEASHLRRSIAIDLYDIGKLRKMEANRYRRLFYDRGGKIG